MKNLLIALFSLILSVGISSCKKDEPGIGSTKTVTVKVTGSANLQIQDIIIVRVGLSGQEGDTQTHSDLNASEWEKEITYDHSISVSVNGTTKDEEKGTMKVQLIDKNGKVLKESQAEGKLLVATVIM